MSRGIRNVRDVGVLTAVLVFSLGAIALGAFDSNSAGAKASGGARVAQSKVSPRITGRVVLNSSTVHAGNWVRGRVLIYNHTSKPIRLNSEQSMACARNVWRVAIVGKQVTSEVGSDLVGCIPGAKLIAKPGLNVLHFKIVSQYSDCDMNKPAHPTIDNVWCNQRPFGATGWPALPAGTYSVTFDLVDYSRMPWAIKPAKLTLTRSSSAPRITGRVVLNSSTAKVGATLHGRVLIYNRSSRAIKMVTGCPGELWQMTIGNKEIQPLVVWASLACSPGVSLTARPGLTVVHFQLDAGYVGCSQIKVAHPSIDHPWCGQRPVVADGMPALPAGTYHVGLVLDSGRRYDITPAQVKLNS